MRDARKNPERHPLSPVARAFSAKQLRIIRDAEAEAEIESLSINPNRQSSKFDK